MSTKNAIDCFQDFLVNIAPNEPVDKDRLFLAAGLLELMRRVKNNDTLLAMAKMLAELPDVNWSRIPFSVTRTFLDVSIRKKLDAAGIAEKDMPRVLLTALSLFVAFVQNDVELSAAVVDDIVAAAVDDFLAATPKPKLKTPELVTDALMSRAFTPAKITNDSLQTLGAQAVYFKGHLPGAKLGPDVRGVCFDDATGTLTHIVLETGEYVQEKPKALNVASIVDADEIKNLPASLLLSLNLSSVNLFMRGVLNKEQESAIHSGCFGKLTGTAHHVTVSEQDLQPLEHVFNVSRAAVDRGSFGATGPVGATVRFPVPDTDMVVVISATQSAAGPYGVSKLVRVDENENDVVLMRYDTPRLLTAKGVYIFPTKDSGFVSLTTVF
jgi:hypothetical protein